MAEVQQHGFEFQERVRDRSGWKKGVQINQADSFDLPFAEAPVPFPFSFGGCNGHSKTHTTNSIHLADAQKYIQQKDPYYLVLGKIKQSSPKYKVINEITIVYISVENHNKICGNMTYEHISELKQLVNWDRFPRGMCDDCRKQYKQWIINHPFDSYIKLKPTISDSTPQRRIQCNFKLKQIKELIGESNITILNETTNCNHFLQPLIGCELKSPPRKL